MARHFWLSKTGARRHVFGRQRGEAVCTAKIVSLARDESVPICGNCQHWLNLVELFKPFVRAAPAAEPPGAGGETGGE